MPIFEFLLFLITSGLQWNLGACNLPPVFTHDMNNLALSEATPVGTVVYTLEGFDPENSEVMYGLIGTNNFMVDPKTGDVEIVKPLDREVNDEQENISFLNFFLIERFFLLLKKTATRHVVIFGDNKRSPRSGSRFRK